MQPIVRTLVVALVVALLAAAAAAPAGAAKSDVSLTKVLGGYTRPLLVTHAPGESGVIYVVEQTGQIKRATFRDGRWVKVGTFLDLRGVVNDPRTEGGERGLLGLAFHPDYLDNGRFYVNYTRAASGAKDGDTVIAEYRRASSAAADPGSGRVLMVINQKRSNHNGGHLAFGPDGKLYIASGDGGGSGDPDGNGQKLRNRLGALLRIDPLDPDGSGPRAYRTPKSNPRVGKTGQNDLWSWGLRNPWRFSFDRKNGNIWIADVGQGAREEVNRDRANDRGRAAGKGKNYGWNRCEGKRRYPDTSRRCTFGARPKHDYAHGNGRCSVTGGHVHRGPSAPEWRGLYVAGDFCGALFVLDQQGRLRLSKVTDKRIASFGEDADGRIYLADLIAGDIYRVKFSGPRP
jgi:glucose/arabinose dehydrogenase